MSVTLKLNLNKWFCCIRGSGLFHMYIFENAGMQLFDRIQPTPSSENAVRPVQSTDPALNKIF